MQGYDKYTNLMADWSGEFIRPYIDKKRKMPEQSRVFLIKLFYGFTEISGTLEALKLSEILVSLAPPRSVRVKRDEYLKYHINSYLQEIYILKERLNSYATQLKRVYSKTDQKEKFNSQVDPVFSLVKTSLKGIIDTRGGHVHSYRYSDEDLNLLSWWTLISNFNKGFTHDANGYKWVKRIWKDRIKENNNQIMKLLDIYFECLYEGVTQNGKVVVPSKAQY